MNFMTFVLHFCWFIFDCMMLSCSTLSPRGCDNKWLLLAVRDREALLRKWYNNEKMNADQVAIHVILLKISSWLWAVQCYKRWIRVGPHRQKKKNHVFCTHYGGTRVIKMSKLNVGETRIHRRVIRQIDKVFLILLLKWQNILKYLVFLPVFLFSCSSLNLFH